MGNSSSENLDINEYKTECKNCDILNKHIEEIYKGVDKVCKTYIENKQHTYNIEKETYDKVIKQCKDSIEICDMTMDYTKQVNKNNLELMELLINQYKKVLREKQINEIYIDNDIYLFDLKKETILVKFVSKEDIDGIDGVDAGNCDHCLIFNNIAEFYKYLLSQSQLSIV